MHDPGRPIVFWAALFFGRIICVTAHELGHALAARAVGFRFRQINVGPVTITRDKHGHRHFHFEWTKLLAQTGFTAAVPANESGIRSDEILVVFAGPLASLLGGLVLALAFLQLPGSAWERSWPAVAAFSLMFLADFVANLIPIGYSDGTMLWHLVLWTRHGRDLCSHLLGAKIHADADERATDVDYEGELKLRERALEEALVRGERNSAELGLCYQALGFAQIRDRWEEAERNFRKSLDILVPRAKDDPLFVANSWSGLSTACKVQQKISEAMLAYQSAVEAFERRKQISRRVDRVEMRGILARLHVNFDNFPAALREVGPALEEFPEGAKYLIRKANLYQTRMSCEFRLGCPERGFEAAEEAARILRCAEIPVTQRNQAIEALGHLGVALWMAERVSEAAALLREAVQAFEDRGLFDRAAHFRLVMCTVLRKDGRLADAEAALPQFEKLGVADRRKFLDERSEIRLESGQIEEAIAGFEAVVRLGTENPPLGTMESAMAQASLAAAYFAADRLDESEACARRAADVFRPIKHPELAEAMVTLASIAWRRGQDARACWPEALRVVVDAPLMEPASKARFFERTARRLERAERFAEAAEARAAAAQWRTLGRQSGAEAR